MRRLLAIIVAGLLGFSAPAFAQTSAPDDASQAAPQATGPNGEPISDAGLDTLAQAPPPPPSYGPLLFGGLAVGGIAAVVVVATQHHNNNSTTTAAAAASP